MRIEMMHDKSNAQHAQIIHRIHKLHWFIFDNSSGMFLLDLCSQNMLLVCHMRVHFVCLWFGPNETYSFTMYKISMPPGSWMFYRFRRYLHNFRLSGNLLFVCLLFTNVSADQIFVLPCQNGPLVSKQLVLRAVREIIIIDRAWYLPATIYMDL